MNDPRHLLPAVSDQVVILLVDDEPLIRNVASIVLEAEGYFVLAAADGEEALELSRHFPGNIHLLLSDIRMPRLDGLALRDRVAAERPATRILLMSGQSDVPTIQPFLRKPFNPVQLKQAVRRTLANRAQMHT